MAGLDLSQIKGIIFDYGGTLGTHGDHWSHVIWDAYRKAGVIVDYDAFRDAYVYGERELARTLHILPHHDFHDLLLIKMQIELQYLAEGEFINPQEITPKAKEIAALCYQAASDCIAQAKPVLAALHGKYPLVLVSNFYGNVQTVLKDFGIDIYFNKVIESAVVGFRKPDPRIFALGVEALGLKPEQVLVIGDSYRKDIVPAMSIGCRTILIKGRAWTPEEEAVLHPSTITDLSQVLALLENV